jgi:hypothetical protein
MALQERVVAWRLHAAALDALDDDLASTLAATSLEDLANELRGRWARGWLAKGGPARWLGDLTSMGAARIPTRWCGT